MRTGSTVLVLLLASGCDRLFQLDRVKLARDSGGVADSDSSDSGDATGDASPCSNPGNDIRLPLVADTWLQATAQGLDGDVVASSGSHILLTFDTLGYNIASLSLTLTARSVSPLCGTCNTCQRVPGMLQFYRSRTDWDEGSATLDFRAGGSPWDNAAATGNADRSEPLEATFNATKVVHQRAFPPNYVDPFVDPAHISFHIEAAGAVATFFSRESVKCNGSEIVTPPELTVRCRP